MVVVAFIFYSSQNKRLSPGGQVRLHFERSQPGNRKVIKVLLASSLSICFLLKEGLSRATVKHQWDSWPRYQIKAQKCTHGLLISLIPPHPHVAFFIWQTLLQLSSPPWCGRESFFLTGKLEGKYLKQTLWDSMDLLSVNILCFQCAFWFCDVGLGCQEH